MSRRLGEPGSETGKGGRYGATVEGQAPTSSPKLDIQAWSSGGRVGLRKRNLEMGVPGWLSQ